MKHLIRVEYPHKGHLAEIKSLGKHLGTDKHIQPSLFKLPYHGAGPAYRPGRIGVQASHPDTSEYEGKFVLNFLRTKSFHAQVGGPA